MNEFALSQSVKERKGTTGQYMAVPRKADDMPDLAIAHAFEMDCTTLREHMQHALFVF